MTSEDNSESWKGNPAVNESLSQTSRSSGGVWGEDDGAGLSFSPNATAEDLEEAQNFIFSELAWEGMKLEDYYSWLKDGREGLNRPDIDLYGHLNMRRVFILTTGITDGERIDKYREESRRNGEAEAVDQLLEESGNDPEKSRQIIIRSAHNEETTKMATNPPPELTVRDIFEAIRESEIFDERDEQFTESERYREEYLVVPRSADFDQVFRHLDSYSNRGGITPKRIKERIEELYPRAIVGRNDENFYIPENFTSLDR